MPPCAIPRCPNNFSVVVFTGHVIAPDGGLLVCGPHADVIVEMVDELEQIVEGALF